jgi:uncharacterized membrane protein
MTSALMVAALLGGGTAAGVMFAVAVSVVPALRDLPVDRYIQAHQLLGRNWDPTMPIIVLGTCVAEAVLAGVVGSAAITALFAIASTLMLASSLVSHLLNVPLNRMVKRMRFDVPPPPGWRDPRPEWRRWHLLRTSFIIIAFTATACAVAIR